MGTTTVQLDDSTHEALEAIGAKGETFDDVVRDLVEAKHGEGAIERLSDAQLAK